MSQLALGFPNVERASFDDLVEWLCEQPAISIDFHARQIQPEYSNREKRWECRTQIPWTAVHFMAYGDTQDEALRRVARNMFAAGITGVPNQFRDVKDWNPPVALQYDGSVS